MKLMVVLLGLFNNICLNLRKLYAKINKFTEFKRYSVNLLELYNYVSLTSLSMGSSRVSSGAFVRYSLRHK